MKRTALLIWSFLPVLLAGVTACKRPGDPPAAVCRLISTTDQLMEANGRLTDEMQRTFTYTNALLTSVAERTTNQEAGFLVERVNERVMRATSGTSTVMLGYGPVVTQPGSATLIRGGRVASTFVMDYTPAGRMSRVVENRFVLPLNSLTVERAFTFAYDNVGNLTTERVRFTLLSGVVVEQETDYVVDSKPSPYVHFTDRALLTVVALSQAIETKPGRFWHINAPTAYKSYNMAGSGIRGNLRESATFVTTYDTDSKLTSQEQSALLYQLSVPDPITKRNRQAFSYQCD